MKEALAGAGRRFLHTALAALIVLVIAAINATSTDELYGYGLVFLVAFGASVLKFIQEVAPFLSWSRLRVPQPWAAWLDALTQAAISAVVVLGPAVLNAPDLNAAKVALLALATGVLTAVARAAEGLLTKGEQPAPGTGIG